MITIQDGMTILLTEMTIGPTVAPIVEIGSIVEVTMAATTPVTTTSPPGTAPIGTIIVLGGIPIILLCKIGYQLHRECG